MKKLIAVVGILAIVVAMSPAIEAGETAAAKVLKSIARVDIYIQTEQGTMQGACTAFSINEQKDLFMTAAHCVDAGTFRIDTQLGWLAYYNEEIDVAVIQSPGAGGKPALKPSALPLDIGDKAFATGYAFGMVQPMTLFGQISRLAAIGVDPDYPEQTFLVLDRGLIGGMSGGPLTDANGDVITVNQMTASWHGADVGLGRPLDVILKHTHQFWGK